MNLLRRLLEAQRAHQETSQERRIELENQISAFREKRDDARAARSEKQLQRTLEYEAKRDLLREKLEVTRHAVPPRESSAPRSIPRDRSVATQDDRFTFHFTTVDPNTACAPCREIDEAGDLLQRDAWDLVDPRTGGYIKCERDDECCTSLFRVSRDEAPATMNGDEFNVRE
jgi:hypothetical protein